MPQLTPYNSDRNHRIAFAFYNPNYETQLLERIAKYWKEKEFTVTPINPKQL